MTQKQSHFHHISQVFTSNAIANKAGMFEWLLIV